MSPALLIRADAGHGIGMGHVMRCLAVAEEAAARGMAVEFVIGGDAGLAAVTRRGFAARRASDVDQDLAPVGRGDVVLLDGYALSPGLAPAVRALGALVVVVDDRTDLPAVADVIVSPDVMPGSRSAPAEALALEGPDFALVRQEFLLHRRLRPEATGGPLLVAMGGSDPLGLSRRTASAGQAGGWSAVEILAGPAMAGTPPSPGVTVTSDPLDVAEVFDRAGAVVSACGASAWELLAMGQVCALAAVIPDQETSARMIAAAGAALTHVGVDGLDAWVTHAVQVLGVPSERRGLSEQALDLIDGAGARRVVDTILSL